MLLDFGKKKILANHLISSKFFRGSNYLYLFVLFLSIFFSFYFNGCIILFLLINKKLEL